jgi:hypothetical protein
MSGTHHKLAHVLREKRWDWLDPQTPSLLSTDGTPAVTGKVTSTRYQGSCEIIIQGKTVSVKQVD